MANQTSKNKNRMVDDAGVRLAPQPIVNSDYHVMPSVMQQYVIEPTIVNKQPQEEEVARVCTKGDYQPTSEDASKKWKRKKRAVNAVSALVAFIASVAVLVPYILAYTGTVIDFPIRLATDKYNVVGALVSGVQELIAMGVTSHEAGALRSALVPHIILAIGILAVVVNMIKCVFGLLISKKQVRYTWGAWLNLACVIAIFIASLVGAPSIGIDKIDFMTDLVQGYASSELFTLIAFSIGYVVVCHVCALINRDKCGYLK